jgi:hypothetical protein
MSSGTKTSLNGCRDVTVSFDCAVLDLVADYAAARKISITEAVQRLVNIALLETSEWTDYLTAVDAHAEAVR